MRSVISAAMQSLRASQASAFLHASIQARQPLVSRLLSIQTRSQSNSFTSQVWSRFRALRQRPRPRNYSSRPSPDVTAQLGSPVAKIGMRERFKQLGKEYGYLSVAVYLTFSALDFPFCFLAVRLAGPERIGQIEHSILSTLKGISDPVWSVIGPVVGPIAGPAVDIVSEVFSRMKKGIVKTAGFDGESTGHENSSGAASIWTQLALAYGIHKTLLIFVRVPLTIAYTPRIARALRARGWKIGSSKK